VGLIVAAIGYAWSVVVGIPLVIWGRRSGLISPTEGVQVADAEPHQVEVVSPGGLERLAQQVVTIGVIYLATYGVCRAAAFGFERGGLDDIGHMVWGFHFIIGALLAMAARPVLTRFPGGSPLDDALLGKLAGLTVDVSTCAALAAVQLSVLAANWLPILAVTTVGGLATLVFCVVVAVRGFRDAPFEHCVIWFGTGTGTLPMGLCCESSIRNSRAQRRPAWCGVQRGPSSVWRRYSSSSIRFPSWGGSRNNRCFSGAGSGSRRCTWASPWWLGPGGEDLG
jgi:ESS family glutamate:Na+ symporter